MRAKLINLEFISTSEQRCGIDEYKLSHGVIRKLPCF